MKYLSFILAMGLLSGITAAAPAKKKAPKAEASVLMQRSNGIYSLHEAAAAGNAEVLTKRLAEPSHNINQKDESGNTPLHIAKKAKHQNIVKLLQQAGADASPPPADKGQAPRETPAPQVKRDKKSEKSAIDQHPVPQFTDFSKLNSDPSQVEKNYRHREFKAYLPLHILGQRYKVGNYSSFENPTGIAFEAGDTLSIRMEGKPRTHVEFIVQDFRANGKQSRFPLTPGNNQFTLTHAGHGYVNYRDEDPATAPAIKLHISGGYINGVFTRHDNTKTWKRLLQNAKSEIFDIIGERTQWVLDLNALRTSCPTKGPELVALYDRQMQLEQQLMGWDWEGIHPGNHIMGRVIWQGYMHADGLGGAFHCSVTPGIANVDQAKKGGSWGTSHEFGHVNQTRPGLNWEGTTEVTVNLFAQRVNLDFAPNEMRLEHETCPTLEKRWMRGGRFDCYVNSALVNRQLWQFQIGPDDGQREPGERRGDQFVALCPLWQLYLYNTVARGDELFYPRIFKNVRDTDESTMRKGEFITRFITRCCDSAQLDLSDFFIKTGMLAVMNRYIEDYSSAWFTITEDMCRQALKHARRYPKPDSPVIFYINTNNAEIYRDKRNIVPSPDFSPVVDESKQPSFLVPAAKWANAVAFEVYDKSGKLLRICLRGLNQQDNKSTEVLLPPGADAVMAVQWDGKRFTIYSASGATIDAKPDSCTGPGQPKRNTKKKRKRK